MSFREKESLSFGAAASAGTSLLILMQNVQKRKNLDISGKMWEKIPL